MARPYRHPVKVLCIFKAFAKVSGSTIMFRDAIMIRVERSSDIEETFKWEMTRRIRAGGGRVGPVPKYWELVSYIPENGLRYFDITEG
jgi:hypothetical protein